MKAETFESPYFRQYSKTFWRMNPKLLSLIMKNSTPVITITYAGNVLSSNICRSDDLPFTKTPFCSYQETLSCTVLKRSNIFQRALSP